MIESAARALGCPVIPAGTGQTEQQLRVIEQLRPAAYAGTPSFLKILLERGRAEGVDLSCFSKALVSGEAFPRALADELRAEPGIDAYQSYGTADLGLIAYETPAREGLVVDEGVLVEIVRPGTGDPVPAGEVGEVVVTSFNPDYPLIRFATGDLSALHARPEPVRAHQPAPARLARPRRSDHQGQGHVRLPEPGRRGRQAPSRGRPPAAGGRARGRSRPDDPALRGGRAGRRASARRSRRACGRRPGCAARCGWSRAARSPTTAR